MTIVDDEIFDFFIDGLKNEGIKIEHFSLIASKQTVETRLKKRGDKNAWNFKQVDRCLHSLKKPKYETHIDTEINDLDEVVEHISTILNLKLEKPRLNSIMRKINWLKISLKNIR